MFGLRNWLGGREDGVPLEPRPVPVSIPEFHEDNLGHLPDVQRAMRRQKLETKKFLHQSLLAEKFIAYLREEGFCDYPHLSDDLDDEMFHFFETRNYEPIAPRLIKEEMVTKAGVHRKRERLKDYNPKHRFIMQRLRTLKSTNDRPVLYYVSPHVLVDVCDPVESVPAPYSDVVAAPVTPTVLPGRPPCGPSAGAQRPIAKKPQQRRAA